MANGDTVGAEAFLPAKRDLETLRAAAAGCRGCDLWRCATQPVFGQGPNGARMMLAGEQPGDQEDEQGRPFVGPAGRLLDRALAEAGINREAVYVTNVVKHFKWQARGARRIHKTPSRWEVTACQPWFSAELDALGPEVLVLLGATASKAVFGWDFRVTRHQGHRLEGPHGVPTIATIHPSAVLRAPDKLREQHLRSLVHDLGVAAGLIP